MLSGKNLIYFLISIIILSLVLLNYNTFAQDKKSEIPLIGSKAPEFSAKTTKGVINFPKDYKGKWVILFSHPSDFTPVCTTEFMTFATASPEFSALNTELIGLSVDGVSSHIAWLDTIKKRIKYKDMENVEVNFPVIADVDMNVSKKYGMIQPEASNTHAVRAVFVIDPEGIIRSIIYYPLTTGRNIEEIKRLIKALQVSDKYKVTTPANWQPGEKVIIPPPDTYKKAQERMDDPNCLDWFMCFKELEQVKKGQ